MTRLAVSWDQELWRWTLTAEHRPADTAVASWIAADVAVHVDASTGELLEVTIDTLDDRGTLDETAAAALDLLLGRNRPELTAGQSVQTDPDGDAELTRRALDTHRASTPVRAEGSGPVGAVNPDGPAAVDRSWIPTGLLDLSTLRTRLHHTTGVLEVTCGIDPRAYVPAVGAVTAVVIDEDEDLVIGLAAFRAGTTPDGPGAIAEVIVGRDIPVERLGLVVTSDPSTLPSKALRRLRAR